MSDVHLAPELVRFHLGGSDDAEHARVDAHLMECPTCLAAFLALKRRFDFAAAGEERPSAAARDRLRTQVRRRLAPRAPAPRWLALGAGLAAAAALWAMWVSRTEPRPGSKSPTHAPTLIDTGADPALSPVL